MNYWLMKTEPETYGWDDLVREGKTKWEGVRSFAARNHMASMKKGDQVFIYHSVIGKEIVGIGEVIKEAYPDKTSEDENWVVVDIKPVKKLKNPVTLAQIKRERSLKDMKLVKIGRLSVSPVEKEEWDVILQLSNNA